MLNNLHLAQRESLFGTIPCTVNYVVSFVSEANHIHICAQPAQSFVITWRTKTEQQYDEKQHQYTEYISVSPYSVHWERTSNAYLNIVFFLLDARLLISLLCVTQHADRYCFIITVLLLLALSIENRHSQFMSVTINQSCHMVGSCTSALCSCSHSLPIATLLFSLALIFLDSYNIFTTFLVSDRFFSSSRSKIFPYHLVTEHCSVYIHRIKKGSREGEWGNWHWEVRSGLSWNGKNYIMFSKTN